MRSKLETLNEWMTTAEVCQYRHCHRQTVIRYRVPWTDCKPKPGQIRYKVMVIGIKRLPRYFRPDVEIAYAPGAIPSH